MFTVKKFNKISDVVATAMPADKYAFIEEGDKYDAALVRSAELCDMVFPKELLAIARAGAGVNNIPIERCTEAGIVVFNTPGANSNAVKELVICALLLSCRGIIPGAAWVKEQHDRAIPEVDVRMEKAKKDFVGGEIAGKRLGVIGLGAIGILVANAADALGMEVIGYDPYLKVDGALKLSQNVKLTEDIDDIYKTCDFITLHLPQTAATRKMINDRAIDQMKGGTVLLNFARGGLIDDEAVLKALENGRLKRYATDFPNDRIIENENVIALPHLGASTAEAEENCAKMAALELDDYLKNGNIKNSVNLPECSAPRGTGPRIAVICRNTDTLNEHLGLIIKDTDDGIEKLTFTVNKDMAYCLIDIRETPDNGFINALCAMEEAIRVRILE